MGISAGQGRLQSNTLEQVFDTFHGRLSGDVFFLASDGFYEWANPDEEEFGTGRVFDVIEQNPGASAKETIDLVKAAVKKFARGTPQDDDLTAVVVVRR